MKNIISGIILIILPLCSTKSQQPIHSFGNNRVSTSAISFTSDGKLILVGGYAKFFDIELEKVDFRTIPKDTETQMDFSFDAILSSDNHTFLLTKGSRIEIWDKQIRKIIKTIRDNQLIPTAVCFSHDEGDIIYLRKKGELVFVNSTTYKETIKTRVSETPISICLSPDGNSLLIGTNGNEIVSFDLISQRSTKINIDSKEIEHIEFSPNGDYVAASSSDGRVWLGRYPSMESVRSWQAHSEGQTAISFHPSGQYLASGGKDKMICIWRIPECTIVSQWEAHKFPLSSLAFSPSGTKLASGSFNAVARFGGEDTKLWSFSEPSQFVSTENENIISKLPDNIPVVVSQTNVSTQKRIALVIGNGTYVNSILANPENDAREFKNVLAQYGFDVIEYENLNQIQMKKAIDEFGLKLKNYDVGLFYYAGHGIQSKGFNYLIPVDAVLNSEQEVEYDCVQADRVLGEMEASGAKVNIMILDACRNNPFERSWTRATSGKGLAYMNAPSGTLIAYATAPGSTASDGGGSNGLYTSAILESIRIPNLTILQMFQNVRSIVSQKSNKQQIPWESTSLTGDFYFYQVNH
jgi:WD40 repeat protein